MVLKGFVTVSPCLSQPQAATCVFSPSEPTIHTPGCLAAAPCVQNEGCKWLSARSISTPFFPTLHLIFSLSPSTESFTHSSYLHVGLAAQLTHSPRSPFNIIFLVLVELYCGYLAGSHPKTVLPCSQQMGKEWKMICDPGSNVSLATYWLRDGELVSGLTHFKGDANKNLLH